MRKGISNLILMLLLARTFPLKLRTCGVLAATPRRSLYRFRGGSNDQANQERRYRTLQVQIVHRHGDRTPITQLKDEEYWAQTLVNPTLLEKIAANTKVVTTGEPLTHAAGGKGPFGKLTQLGLLQLVDLGNRLREELSSDKHYDDEEAFEEDPHDKKHKLFRYPWHAKRPLHPTNIKVISTNFPRTIQSVQGLLVGLFPDGTEETIHIDARHTDILIPDPQPRRTPEQEALEAELALQPHLKVKEKEMRPLAIRATEALRDSLGEGALGVTYGVGEEQSEDSNRHLSWAQLAEITNCLKVRNLLPPSITPEDQEIISKHCAWRWFESLRHPRLAYLAMNPMVSKIVEAMHQHEEEPPVIIYSAHDSTLIGLLCGFRLEMPSVWPEYASYLKMELLEVTSGQGEKEHVVRFSLNGNLLRSVWEEGKPLIEIPLEVLTHKVNTEGKSAA